MGSNRPSGSLGWRYGAGRSWKYWNGAAGLATSMFGCAKETVWWEIDESSFFSPCLNPKQELPQTEPLDAPMRRHMGTSSTTKGCSSPAHHFNTVSSPDVSPGGRKAALHGENVFGI